MWETLLAEALSRSASKDPVVPALLFAPDAWDAFCAGVKSGELGLA
jgi:hypothetical protein